MRCSSKTSAAAVSGTATFVPVALAFVAHLARADVGAIKSPLPPACGGIPFALVYELAGWEIAYAICVVMDRDGEYVEMGDAYA